MCLPTAFSCPFNKHAALLSMIPTDDTNGKKLSHFKSLASCFLSSIKCNIFKSSLLQPMKYVKEAEDTTIKLDIFNAINCGTVYSREFILYDCICLIKPQVIYRGTENNFILQRHFNEPSYELL